jgi:hypothetical protein
MSVRLKTAGGVATLAVLGAAIAVAFPFLVPLAGPLGDEGATLPGIDPQGLLLQASLLVGLVAVAIAINASRAAGVHGAVDGPVPEQVTAARQESTGQALDDRIAAGIDGDEAALVAVRDRLRAVAIGAYAGENGTSREAAARAIHTGRWTQERTAAAMLSDGTGETHSIPARLRLWLDPAAERRRRLARTVDAIDRLGEVAHG